MKEDDWIVTEEHLKIIGACEDGIELLRKYNMFGMKASELKAFATLMGRPQYLE